MEDSHPAGLGGEYPEWEPQIDVMAAWRREQQFHQEQEEAHPHTHTEETAFLHSNDTQNTQKTAVLIDLNTHRYA